MHISYKETFASNPGKYINNPKSQEHIQSDCFLKIRIKTFKQFLRKERGELPIDFVSGTSEKKGKSITVETNGAVPAILLSESTRALNT